MINLYIYMPELEIKIFSVTSLTDIILFIVGILIERMRPFPVRNAIRTINSGTKVTHNLNILFGILFHASQTLISNISPIQTPILNHRKENA
jgi:hypothetical protein